MTAATINNSFDFTTTPSSPLVVVDITAPATSAVPTVALPSTGDGKTYRAVSGMAASGSAIKYTVSTNTATVTGGMIASERGTLTLIKS